jgi:hypothetical protein
MKGLTVKRNNLIQQAALAVLFALACILGSPAAALAQAADVEPNSTCSTAQNVGEVTSTLTINGSIDRILTVSDVDFYRFTGTPGQRVIIDLEGQPTAKGTLQDPFLGVFNSFCNLIGVNDDNGGLNSRLQITIPFDGVVIVAATSCCDNGFSVGGDGIGTYTLTIAPVPIIRAIRGRVVDAVNGTPLSGTAPPFAFVQLTRCSNFGCFEFVGFQSVDNDGRFRFDREFGSPLIAGTYQLTAFAEQYQQTRTDQFNVAQGEEHDLGSVALTSFPVRFSEIRPCGSLPREGGDCVYSVRLTNGLATSLSADAWSLVDSSNIGPLFSFTRFQTQNPQNVSIAAGKSKVVEFRFHVPSTVTNGASICTSVFVGSGRDAFFDIVGQRSTFCISKGNTGFSVLPEKESHLRMRPPMTQPSTPNPEK